MLPPLDGSKESFGVMLKCQKPKPKSKTKQKAY
jgi:hypothetical protein